MCMIKKSTGEWCNINPSPDRECLLLCASARNASVRFRRNFARIAVHREGQRRVDLTRSPGHRRMAAICAKRTLSETPRYSSRFGSKPVQTDRVLTLKRADIDENTFVLN